MSYESEKIWFEEILFPQRSLGKTGFRILMTVIFVLSAAIGIMFYTLGAWPVTGFFGLDALLIYAAFKIHYQHGKASEIIRLTENEFTISRIDHKGRRQDFSYNPYWVNIRMACPPNVPQHVGETFLEARSHGKGTFFGTFITQDKRHELLSSLRSVLANYKTNRFS